MSFSRVASKQSKQFNDAGQLNAIADSPHQTILAAHKPFRDIIDRIFSESPDIAGVNLEVEFQAAIAPRTAELDLLIAELRAKLSLEVRVIQASKILPPESFLPRSISIGQR